MDIKTKCVIFGAGGRGTKIYKKLIQFFDVIAYADNNKALWGECLNGVPIMPPDELPDFIKNTNATVFIVNELHYQAIAKQLDGLGLSYYNCENFLCYALEDGVWYPVSFGRPKAYQKPDKDKPAVLFVQNAPCARTNKIAEVLKSKGVLTYSAYTAAPSDAGDIAFLNEFPFWTYSELLDFVNESEFDIIHCSNTPDILVSLLIHSNKKVVHDCHDIVSMATQTCSSAEMALEYIANTQADGVIYTTQRMKEILQRKYARDPETTIVFGNYASYESEQVKRLPKLSAADSQIHCVYEGYIVDASQAEEMPYRFFEPIFIRLAASGVHVHIYSSVMREYLTRLDHENAYIHYEGNFCGKALIEEMTRYDLGLLLYPLRDATYMNLSSPNKMTEYLAGGLPVITNVKPLAEILLKNGGGDYCDLEQDDLIKKLNDVKKINISPGFCERHKLTIQSNVNDILQFYRRVMNG